MSSSCMAGCLLECPPQVHAGTLCLVAPRSSSIAACIHVFSQTLPQCVQGGDIDSAFTVESIQSSLRSQLGSLQSTVAAARSDQSPRAPQLPTSVVMRSSDMGQRDGPTQFDLYLTTSKPSSAAPADGDEARQHGSGKHHKCRKSQMGAKGGSQLGLAGEGRADRHDLRNHSPQPGCWQRSALRWLCAHRHALRVALYTELAGVVLLAALHLAWCHRCRSQRAAAAAREGAGVEEPLLRVEEAAAWAAQSGDGQQFIVSPLWSTMQHDAWQGTPCRA